MHGLSVSRILVAENATSIAIWVCRYSSYYKEISRLTESMLHGYQHLQYLCMLVLQEIYVSKTQFWLWLLYASLGFIQGFNLYEYLR